MKKYFLVLVLISSSLTLFAKKDKVELVAGQNANWEVKLRTSEGVVELLLYNDTPLHRDNFVKLAKAGFYDHLLFHRVIKEFMIQCGDPQSREANKTVQYGEFDSGYKIPSEIRPQYYHRKGVLAAAREPDSMNPERLSSGSHFYIVVGKVHNDSTLAVAKERIALSQGAEITAERETVYRSIGGAPHLDGSYTIFGEVISGMRVVEKICSSETFKNDRPKVDVYIKSIDVRLVEKKEE